MPSAYVYSKKMQTELDLSYKEKFYTGAQGVYSPDAYTRLLLDTLRGKQSAFVRGDELLEAWKVMTPFLLDTATEKAYQRTEILCHLIYSTCLLFSSLRPLLWQYIKTHIGCYLP